MAVRFPIVTILLFAVLFVAVREIPASLHRVTGDSMVPTMHDGETIVVNRFAYRFFAPQPGDLLVFRDPGTSKLAVKRVTDLVAGSRVYLTGDNPTESVDSRHLGGIATDSIVGRVLFRGYRR